MFASVLSVFVVQVVCLELEGFGFFSVLSLVFSVLSLNKFSVFDWFLVCCHK